MQWGIPPFELAERISSKELTWLIEYSKIEPFGSVRDNWHTAILAQMYASAHTPKHKIRPQIKDFMWVDPKSKATRETKSFLGKLRGMAKNGDSRS